MSVYLTITPRDPIIARDGRPFNEGARMRSMPWPSPSLVAGSLRSLLGSQEMQGLGFDSDLASSLKGIAVAGPLALRASELWFSLPADLVCFGDDPDDPRIMPLRPRLTQLGGCNIPAGILPVGVDMDIKPTECPALWSGTAMASWLVNPTGGQLGDRLYGVVAPSERFMPLPAQDDRIHTRIDPETLAVEEGMLFGTVGLDFSRRGEARPLKMSLRVEPRGEFASAIPALDTLAPLGGERRLAHWSANGDGCAAWRCPDTVSEALGDTNQVRMVLATPALFDGGWLPGWLHNEGGSFIGAPPGITNMRLRLVGACVPRWRPISGWSYEEPVGPKPVRRVAPPGAVYFFDILDAESAAGLTSRWLWPVSDKPQDQRDGFGLALWGASRHDSPGRQE